MWTRTIGSLCLAITGCAVASDDGESSDQPLFGGDPANDAVYGIDISHWEGPMSQYEMDCFWTQGVRHVVSGTQVAEVTRQQLEMADARGMTLDAYVYLYWDRDMTAQVDDAFATAASFPIGRMWLDVEESAGGRSASTLLALVRQAVDACRAHGAAECGIYTRGTYWTASLANTTELADVPLWYARYNHLTSLDSWATERFGGWDRPAAKQWAEEVLCNVGVDKDTIQVLTAPSVVIDRSPPPPPTTVPAAPVGLYPAPGTTVGVPYLKLMARSIDGATSWQHALDRWDAAGQRWIAYYTWTTAVPFRTVYPSYHDRYYRLRVRARNGHGWGAWSEWSTFAYGAPSTPPPGEEPPPPPPPGDGVPVGLAPDGVTVTTPSVTMAWSAITDATSYQIAIEYQVGSAWSSYVTYSSTTASKTFWPQYHGTSYRFRVRAQVGGVFGAWSADATFAYP
jgi:hypothetical protein